MERAPWGYRTVPRARINEGTLALISQWREMLTSGSVDDPGFRSLWGFAYYPWAAKSQ